MKTGADVKHGKGELGYTSHWNHLGPVAVIQEHLKKNLHWLANSSSLGLHVITSVCEF